VFVGFASLFESTDNPVVELGLSIASFTYGGMLGVFLLGRFNRRVSQRWAIGAFLAAIGLMVLVIFGVWVRPDGHLLFALKPEAARVASKGLRSLAWPWYTLLGALLTLLFGSLPHLGHRYRRSLSQTRHLR